MAQWKITSIALHTQRYMGVDVHYHIIEAECPYCGCFSTQRVLASDNKMYYDFCPRCGKRVEVDR